MKYFKLDFIGVGAARAGSTWLFTCLNEHPQICMADQKELNYFCTKHFGIKSPTNYNEGDRWLRARFSHWKTRQIRGEISPSYLVDPTSPRLIKENFPETKIIISYRNPTDSLYSLYYQIAKTYPVPNTFEEFQEKYPHFIEMGFYYKHTKRYVEEFPSENMHFIIYDDICSDPEKIVVDLFDFLGVAINFRPACLHKRVNEKQIPRSNVIRNILGPTKGLFHTDPKLRAMKTFLKKFEVHRIVASIEAKNLRSRAFAPMKKDTRLRLLEVYAKENMLLGNLLNRDLNHWNK